MKTPVTQPHAEAVDDRCQWCGRRLPEQAGSGRRRRYCGQGCRQRAYEHRSATGRGTLPADAVALTADQYADLADRLFQMRCAAEDVATALDDGASMPEVRSLVAALMDAAREAERIR